MKLLYQKSKFVYLDEGTRRYIGEGTKGLIAEGLITKGLREAKRA